MAEISTLNNEACANSFREAMVSILIGWGEEPDTAHSLAQSEYTQLSSTNIGAHPFRVSSPSTSYVFFFMKNGDHCELKLAERQSAFWRSSTNTWPWLATRSLEECSCREY